MEKVCVRIPASKRAELLTFAKSLRDQEDNARTQGWDAKIVHRIAKEKFGGLQEMFSFHDWPETGSDMMRQVQARVKKSYGSIEAFSDQYLDSTDKLYDQTAAHSSSNRPSQHSLDQAIAIWQILVERVSTYQNTLGKADRSDGLITYGELANKLGLPAAAQRSFGLVLDLVGSYCIENCLPPLSVIVVRKNSRKPGDQALTHKGVEPDTIDVLKTDWLNVSAPTIDSFRKTQNRRLK